MSNASDNPARVNPNASPPTIPGHVLLRRIGRGSYGEVWLARNAIGVFRAVKIVRWNPEDSLPFDQEYRGLRLFEPVSRKHDGLVDILQVGRDDAAGFFYYVMEAADDAVSGHQIDPERYTSMTLEQKIRGQSKGRLTLQECIACGIALASALEFLHCRGLVHRDLKPSNILFVRDTPKLADIGLVIRPDDARTFVGTSGFVAPEGPGTPRADIFGLGKVLYEMATGKDRDAFPSLPTEVDGFADRKELLELNDIILRACHRQPEHRHASAAELRAELEVLAAGRSLTHRRARRRLLVAALWAVSLLILLGAAALAACWYGRLPSTFLARWLGAFDAPGLEIVFQSNATGHSEIWKMKVDGSRRHCLTRHADACTQPMPSPDGRQIAYVHSLAGGTELRVMDRDGNHDRSVLFIERAGHFYGLHGWLPDNLRLVFGTLDPERRRSRVWSVGLVDTNLVQFLDPAACGQQVIHNLRFSGDGRKVAWAAEPYEESSQMELYVAEVARQAVLSNTIVRLTTNQVLDFNPVLAPNNLGIAFVRAANSDGSSARFHAMVQALDNTAAESRIADRLRDPTPTDWSPARRVLLQACQHQSALPQVYSVRPDGRALAQLTRGASANQDARWLTPVRLESPVIER